MYKLGDKLIVALNSDDIIEVLAICINNSLKMVDSVIEPRDIE